MSFTITTTLTDEKIQGILCSGMEGGIGYWAQIVRYEGDTTGAEFKHIEMPLREGGAVILEDAEGEEEGEWRLDRAALQRGLSLLSSLTLAGKLPARHLTNVMTDDYDAETGDVLIQLAVLGEIVYG